MSAMTECLRFNPQWNYNNNTVPLIKNSVLIISSLSLIRWIFLFTLFCDFYLFASKLGLFDVFDAEVGEARGALLALVPGRAFIL